MLALDCVGAGVDDGSLSSTLQQGCPSYFREEDKLYFAANGELRRAQSLQGTQRQDVTRAAIEKLIRVSLCCFATCIDVNHTCAAYKCTLVSTTLLTTPNLCCIMCQQRALQLLRPHLNHI